jgi:hypothetical protein
VAGYSAFRIFEESVRIDSSQYFLGLRLNMYIAIIVTLAGLAWFVLAQRWPARPVVVLPATAAPARAARQDAGQPPGLVRDGKKEWMQSRQRETRAASGP